MPEIIDWLRQEGIELGRAEGLELGKAEGRAEGRAEGIRMKALEDARKLREHGVSWEIIQSATGISPEDLEG